MQIFLKCPNFRDMRTMIQSRTNVGIVGGAFKGMRKVKVLSLPETINEVVSLIQAL